MIITLDDATKAHGSMIFAEEETVSSFQKVREVIEKHGLFGALCTDRGSHYWYMLETGGKVDNVRLTQFGRYSLRAILKDGGK